MESVGEVSETNNGKTNANAGASGGTRKGGGMGRERTSSRRIIRNPKRIADRATLATLSALASSQQNDAPHQGPADYEGYGENGARHEDESDGRSGVGELTHERARDLISAQTVGLLPAAEANALADHLLVCDACYRFAQDVAAQRRNTVSQ